MMERTLVFDTPEKIRGYQLLAMRAALKMEVRGMHHSRVSMYAVIKKEFGLHGSKQRVLDQFSDILRERGILRDA